MTPGWPDQRRAILRDALAVGLAVGMYGLSFGALAVATGLSTWQAITLSSLMFTGGSQFAYIGVIGAGGSSLAAASAALLLGARNTFYGVAMKPLLPTHGWRQVAAAQLTIDESTAMALGNIDPANPRAARLAFWATGVSVFVCWNLATVVGALGAASLGDPGQWGLDAMVPAAFLALLWPRLTSRTTVGVAVVAAVLAIAVSMVAPPGIPVLLGGAVAVVVALWGARRDGDSPGSPSAQGAAS